MIGLGASVYTDDDAIVIWVFSPMLLWTYAFAVVIEVLSSKFLKIMSTYISVCSF